MKILFISIIQYLEKKNRIPSIFGLFISEIILIIPRRPVSSNALGFSLLIGYIARDFYIAEILLFLNSPSCRLVFLFNLTSHYL